MSEQKSEVSLFSRPVHNGFDCHFFLFFFFKPVYSLPHGGHDLTAISVSVSQEAPETAMVEARKPL